MRKTGLQNASLDFDIAKSDKDKTIKANRNDMESTRLDISIQERKIAELLEEMDMGTVTAPCDGIIIELNYSEGMTATSSQPLYKNCGYHGGIQVYRYC